MSDEEEELDGGTVAELPPAAEDEEEELDGGQLGPSQEEEEEELDGGELGEPVDDLFTDQDPFYAAATAQPPWEPPGKQGGQVVCAKRSAGEARCQARFHLTCSGSSCGGYGG